MKHNMIHFRAEFIIKDGKIREYKKLVRRMSRAVEADEPDTLSYRFYFDRNETKCVVHEMFANSEAVFDHNNGFASQTILPKIFRVSRIVKFEVYGKPSKKLKKGVNKFQSRNLQSIYGFHSLTIRLSRSILPSHLWISVENVSD
jgi:quinol monooxygenase YgiN